MAAQNIKQFSKLIQYLPAIVTFYKTMSILGRGSSVVPFTILSEKDGSVFYNQVKKLMLMCKSQANRPWHWNTAFDGVLAWF